MNNANIYVIRRGILRALKDCCIGGNTDAAAPMNVDELVKLAPNTEIMYAAPESVREEWQNLKAHGYIESIPGFGGAYCKITKAGLEQLSIEFPQHPFIHGPGAIK